MTGHPLYSQIFVLPYTCCSFYFHLDTTLNKQENKYKIWITHNKNKTDMPAIQVQSIVIKKKGNVTVTHFRNVTNALVSETIFDPIALGLKTKYVFNYRIISVCVKHVQDSKLFDNSAPNVRHEGYDACVLLPRLFLLKDHIQQKSFNFFYNITLK